LFEPGRREEDDTMPGPDDKSQCLDVRPLKEADVGLLHEAFAGPGGPGLDARRLHDQNLGRGQYLVAWLGTKPAGSAWLGWEQDLAPEISKALGLLPLLVDLYVEREFRRQGVGRSLVGAAEAEARNRGCARIGAAVADDNPAARAFYEALGFADAGLEPRFEAGTWTDADGRRRGRGTWCRLFVKDLGG
jgi:GNAT superfamily N-acetyltransferase